MPKPKAKIRYLKNAELKRYRLENTPESCPILGHADIDPVVDHDHKTGMIRGVVSRQGNSLIGKIENFFKTRCVCATDDLPQVLRNAANYLEQDCLRLLHPVGATQLSKRFKAMSKADQEMILNNLEVDDNEIVDCRNSMQRMKLFRKAMTSKQYIWP